MSHKTITFHITKNQLSVYEFCRKDPARPLLECVEISVNDVDVMLTATDGYKAIEYGLLADTFITDETNKFYVHRRYIERIQKSIKKSKDFHPIGFMLEIDLEDQTLSLVNELVKDYKVTVPLYDIDDGKYPDIYSLFRREIKPSNEVTLNPEYIKTAMNFISKNSNQNTVRIQLAGKYEPQHFYFDEDSTITYGHILIMPIKNSK